MSLELNAHTFRHIAKEKILNYIYNNSVKTLELDYKKLIKEHLTLEGIDPEDIAIHYVTLDKDYYWVGGEFRNALGYGLQPKYIKNASLRKTLNNLNRDRYALKDERKLLNAYITKVLVEAKTYEDIITYLPVAIHNLIEFKAIYKDGQLTENPSLAAISKKYLGIIYERLVVNLLVRN